MPEGDTIAYAANRIRPVLEGHVPDEILTPHPRHTFDRWAERLEGRRVAKVDTYGKHLFIWFGPPGVRAGQGQTDQMSSGSAKGDLVIHSHLAMTGAWGVYAPGRRWRRAPSRAWLVLRRNGTEVVQFDGPLLELTTGGRTRFDQRLAALGPDVLAVEFDRAGFLRRLRSDDQTRGLGDALLDQRNVAGIGNMWKAEGCWVAGIDPWRRVADVSDAEALAVIDAVRPRMQRSAVEGARATTRPQVHRRAGLPCQRCGARILSRGQGDANRTTYWCRQCQT